MKYLIPLFLLTPFIFTAGRVQGFYIPYAHQPSAKAEKAKPVKLWRIDAHKNWTREDKAAAMVYLWP